MLVIICILTFVAFFVSRITDEGYNGRNLVCTIFFICGVVLGFAFCVLLIVKNWNLFTIPKILLFISFSSYILWKEWCELCVPFWFGIFVTVIAYCIAGVMYCSNIEECEITDLTTENRTVLCANYYSPDTGTIDATVFHVHKSSDESVYQYYCQSEDGGILYETIPADSTKVYYIVETGEEPHLETIVTTKYYNNNNNTPATRYQETSETKYKLYIPKDSLVDIYE